MCKWKVIILWIGGGEGDSGEGDLGKNSVSNGMKAGNSKV